MQVYIKLFILLLFWSSSSIASWSTGVWIDECQDLKTKYTYTISKTETLEISQGEFGYRGELIIGKKYSPLSSVAMMRVDKYDAHRITSVSITGLRTGAFDIPDKMIKQMQAGNNVSFNFCDIFGRCDTAKFSLAGSNKALCKILPNLPEHEALCQNKD